MLSIRTKPILMNQLDRADLAKENSNNQLFSSCEPSESKEQWNDDEDSKMSLQYFSLKVKPSSQTSYQMKGSWRICTSFITIRIGLIGIYLVNVIVDSNCLQKFKEQSCSIHSISPKCLELIKCLEKNQSYFFTLEENVVLVISLLFVVVFVCSYKKDHPPRLTVRATKKHNREERAFKDC